MRTIEFKPVIDGRTITDLDPEELARLGNPLVIAGRDGQVSRVSKLMLGGDAVGWWQLGQKGFLDKTGVIKPAMFRKYSAIVYVDPMRVDERVRDTYIKLITYLEKL